MAETITWYIGEDGFPTNIEFIDVPEKAMEKPYPKAVWRIDSVFNNGLPYHELLKQTEILGSFANVKNLQRVSIPKSVKKIGKYAFRNTRLKSVTIAKDCEYFATSFPNGCKINFYT